MIDRPGIYEIDEATYHADCCPSPSLSSGIARDLVAASPLHAWHNHPRLNPNHEPEESDRFDLGRAAHALILEGRDAFEVIDAPDWRTKTAQQARDVARSGCKIPILAGKWEDMQAMAHALRMQLDAFEEEPRPLTGGRPEQTIVWQEPNGIWCRARLDWLHDDGRFIDDLKTGAGSANPDVWTRIMFGLGADVQAAFYLRGYKAVSGIEAQWRFVVCENEPPFACSVVGLTPAVLEIGRRKVEYAVGLWRECMESGRWPGYPARTCYAELPPWIESSWLEKEMREENRGPRIVDTGGPIADLMPDPIGLRAG